jgi:hypothetical protein
VDANDPVDPTYPTAHTPMPLVDYNGGGIIAAPKVVTITFGSDPLRSRLEQFGDTITTTTWWDTVRAGYCAPESSTNCIGKGSSGGHVNITTEPAASYTDSANGGESTIQDFLKAKVADGTFPAPTIDTLYVVYFPSSTQISLDGASSCNEFGGYHNSVTLSPPGGGSDIAVPYAIVPRCDSAESTTTISASHEIIEAATDPDVGATAYYMQDQLWAFAGGEVGDLCVDFTGSNDTYQESGFTVQRSWSNASAKAGHDPCVPVPKGTVYFNAAPKQGQEQLSLGVGASAVIEITAFSDAPMGDWDISALDFDQLQTGQSHLSFSFDKAKVHNGSKVQLTVKLASRPSQGYAPFAIVSKSGKTTHYWPAVVITK